MVGASASHRCPLDPRPHSRKAIPFERSSIGTIKNSRKAVLKIYYSAREDFTGIIFVEWKIIYVGDYMKKFYFLYILTFAALCGIFMTGYASDPEPVNVSVRKLAAENAETIVRSSGKLRYSHCKNVRAKEYAIAAEIFVKNGDYVNKGDTLAEFESFPGAEEILKGINISDLMKYAGSAGAADELREKAKEYSVSEVITAPISGIVSSMNISENDMIQPEMSLLQIADPSSYAVTVNVNEVCIGEVEVGQDVRIKFPAVMDSVFSGHVSAIASEAKQITTLSGKETAVEVTVVLDGNDDRLRIGYSAECEIITAVDKNRLIVPYDDIMTDKTGDHVFVLRKGRAVKRYIRLGKDYQRGAEVLSGLKNGEMIIDDPVAVKDGMKATTEQTG